MKLQYSSTTSEILSDCYIFTMILTVHTNHATAVHPPQYYTFNMYTHTGCPRRNV